MVRFVFCIYDKYNNVVRPTVYRVTLDKKKGMEQTICVRIRASLYIMVLSTVLKSSQGARL